MQVVTGIPLKVLESAVGGVSRSERMDTISASLLNTYSPKVVSEAGSVMVVNAVQPLKAELPISVSPSDSLTLASLEQFSKQLVGITLTPAGIVIEVNAVHSLKAYFTISVKEAGKATFCKAAQKRNALIPIVVSAEGSVTLVNPVQLKNALEGISVMVLGNVSSVNLEHSLNTSSYISFTV